ncbi:MAG: hypothetical protein P4M11_11385 [Candidatus Pacebacteria bacterium]|nr:hypothetical protein [Candidatus Paceibacterota bacterium]
MSLQLAAPERLPPGISKEMYRRHLALNYYLISSLGVFIRASVPEKSARPVSRKTLVEISSPEQPQLRHLEYRHYLDLEKRIGVVQAIRAFVMREQLLLRESHKFYL